MVELNGKPIIEHQLSLFEKFNLKDLNVVTGYLSKKINFDGLKKFHNPHFEITNMVSSLFCASELFNGDDDILISYGDIIYNQKVLKAIIDSNSPINIVIDKNWRAYWELRMTNPLLDAETLKIDESGHIKEIGKKPTNYSEIEGQYIGLIKIRKDSVVKVKKFYQELNKDILYDGKYFQNIYMTSFLQLIADNLFPLSPVFINGGWIEIDEPKDLEFSSLLKE